jgi:glycosyltransferase involved in cell wall biosynthesis
MRILHLIASPVWSGPAEPVALLAAAQRALGHEVKIAIDRKRGSVASEELLLPQLQQIGLLDEGGLELSVKSGPLAILRDVANLRKRQVDVVHAHFTHDHFIARVGRPKGARLVRSIHAPRSLRATTPGCDAFTVPYDQLLARVSGRPSMVLPALVADEFRPAPDRAALKATLGLPEGAPVIGILSTFQHSRRHEIGIDAFVRLRERKPQAHLLLTSNGAVEAEIRARVLSLGLKDSVTFAGYVPTAEFARWVQAVDEVWILGLGNDHSARVAAQARSCGARVVAIDEGALPRYADTIVVPEVQAIAAAALEPQRREVALAPVGEVAAQVLALYEKAKGAA